MNPQYEILAKCLLSTHMLEWFELTNVEVKPKENAATQDTQSEVKDYHINGDNFERSYKEGGRLNGFKRTGPISGFKTWEDADHAEDWVIIPKNMCTHLSIDETCQSTGEVYTILSNKEAHGRKGCLVAIVKGTKAKEVTSVLKKIQGSRT